MSFSLVSGSRRPKGIVKVNGEQITHWIDFDVDNNNFFSADTFRCRFAGAGLPADRNAIWFSQQQDMFVELFIGFPPNPNNYSTADLTSWIYGQVDHIEINPVTNTITVDGRDLTRVFIDAKTTQKWPNQTSSQIATALAKKHGLTPVVTATTTTVGKYYEIDHVNMADERSEWDILNYLADLEGFKVWVRGQSLYFQPPPSGKGVDTAPLQAQLAQVTTQINQQNTQIAQLRQQGDALKAAGDQAGSDAAYSKLTPIASNVAFVLQPQKMALESQIAAAQTGDYEIVWQPATDARGFPVANFESIKLTRALTVSRGIQVKIRSWNKKYAKGFTVAYPSNVKTIKVGQSSVGAGGQIYSKTIANMTQDQALQYAQNWYSQLIAHEMKIEGLTMPGDNNLDVTSTMRLDGTGTAFDQIYYPDSISRSMTFEGGYSMTVSAKNHAPESQVMA